MTPKQKARLDHSNYDSGVRQGSAIAQGILDRNPDGPADEQIATLADEVRQAELSALAVIPKRFRDTFAVGFAVGRSSTFSRFQEQLILSACKGLKPN